jgi:large subunit ribosomal protein L10
MPSEVKEKFVAELTEELKKSPHVLVTEYSGMKADEFNELRAKLRTVGAKYKVVKNRLARIAFKNIGWDGLNEKMKGPSAIAFMGKDSAAVAKVLNEFGTSHQMFKVRAGHVYGKVEDAATLKVIATLPSKEVLLATLLARLNSPLTTLIVTLKEPLRALNASLSAVAKKKEATPAA